MAEMLSRLMGRCRVIPLDGLLDHTGLSSYMVVNIAHNLPLLNISSHNLRSLTTCLPNPRLPKPSPAVPIPPILGISPPLLAENPKLELSIDQANQRPRIRLNAPRFAHIITREQNPVNRLTLITIQRIIISSGEN